MSRSTERILRERKRLGLSQNQFAKECGLNANTTRGAPP
jgi:transcriptional regulator with XRE-family HTH domain